VSRAGAWADRNVKLRACDFCGEEFRPTGPRQRFHPGVCATGAHELREQGLVVESPPEATGGPLRQAMIDTVLDLNRGGSVPRGLTALGSVVRQTVEGQRAKDRRAYEGALKRLAAWALCELARVRSTSDA
jgi:hypothetical protein